MVFADENTSIERRSGPLTITPKVDMLQQRVRSMVAMACYIAGETICPRLWILPKLTAVSSKAMNIFVF
jgi:hypothetical protein